MPYKFPLKYYKLITEIIQMKRADDVILSPKLQKFFIWVTSEHDPSYPDPSSSASKISLLFRFHTCAQPYKSRKEPLV